VLYHFLGMFRCESQGPEGISRKAFADIVLGFSQKVYHSGDRFRGGRVPVKVGIGGSLLSLRHCMAGKDISVVQDVLVVRIVF